MYVNENLKLIREGLGYSQTDVAAKLGITRQGYNHYETGKRIPPLDIMENLCSIFNVDMNALTDSTDLQAWTNRSNFAERLKMLRENKNVSQTQIADFLKISKQTYNNYERAIREPDFETIKKLAEYFNVTTDFLLGNTNDITPQNATKKATPKNSVTPLKKFLLMQERLLQTKSFHLNLRSTLWG